MAKRRNEEEIRAVCRELPQSPPADVFDTMRRRMTDERLIYRAGYYTDPLTGLKEKSALVTCTACGKTYHMSYHGGPRGCSNSWGTASFGFWDYDSNEAVYSGDCCICPECGADARALHIGVISGKYCMEQRYFMTVHIIRGQLIALGWIIYKYCGKDGRTWFDFLRYEGVGVIDGLPVRYAGYVRNMGGNLSVYPQWEARARWRENGDEWDPDEIFFIDRPTFLASEWAKTALDEYIARQEKKIRIGAYLNLWAKYPQIENLVRVGLSSYIRRVIERATNVHGYYTKSDFSTKEAAKWLNTKAVKPHEIVGLEKHDLSYAAKFELDTLAYYKKLLKDGIRLSYKQLEHAQSLNTPALQRAAETAEALNIKVTPVKIINYLSRQIDLYCVAGTEGAPALIGPSYLVDYWNMLALIYGSVPANRLWPRDLIAEHDKAVKIKKDKENEILNAKIAAFAKTCAWLTWEDPETGLCIRPAASQTELIDEGKRLAHCVATYATTMSNGNTCILFIRRIESPEEPFFTLEYKNGRVLQNRGLRNCSRTPEVAAFEAAWLNHIEEVKHGKCTAKKAG